LEEKIPLGQGKYSKEQHLRLQESLKEYTGGMPKSPSRLQSCTSGEKSDFENPGPGDLALFKGSKLLQTEKFGSSKEHASLRRHRCPGGSPKELGRENWRLSTKRGLQGRRGHKKKKAKRRPRDRRKEVQ